MEYGECLAARTFSVPDHENADLADAGQRDVGACVMQVFCCGFYGYADLPDGTSGSGDWREVGNDEKALGVDGIGAAVGSLAGEENFKFVTAAQFEVVLDCA